MNKHFLHTLNIFLLVLFFQVNTVNAKNFNITKGNETISNCIKWIQTLGLGMSAYNIIPETPYH